MLPCFPNPASPNRFEPDPADASPAFEVPVTLSLGAIAEIAALIGDPGRLNMLMALLNGFELSARELADRAGVTPQTASGHIAKLKAAGLIAIERRGRTHLHRLAAAHVERLLEILAQVAADRMPPNVVSRMPCADGAIGIARICRGHIAGSLGVALAERLCATGSAHLTESGRATLIAWGLPAETIDRDGGVARSCLDWSECRPHLAGSLGAAILDRCLTLGWVKRSKDARGLLVTGVGMRGFGTQFGVNVPQGWTA